MNSVILSGRLTKKPELRSTASGTTLCSFNLAVDKGKTDESGNREADFIECVCFNKVAENLCKYQDKGSYIELKGSIQTNSYVDNDNKKRLKTTIRVDMINYISQPKTTVSEPKNSQIDPFKEMGNKINSEYDLPF